MAHRCWQNGVEVPLLQNGQDETDETDETDAPCRCMKQMRRADAFCIVG